MSILNLYYDGDVHTYAVDEEPRKKVLTINSQNKNQEIGIQLTFILKINPQKFIF